MTTASFNNIRSLAPSIAASVAYSLCCPLWAQGSEGQVVEEAVQNIVRHVGVEGQLGNQGINATVSYVQLQRMLGIWHQRGAQWTQAEIDAINAMGPEVGRPTMPPKAARRGAL